MNSSLSSPVSSFSAMACCVPDLELQRAGLDKRIYSLLPSTSLHISPHLLDPGLFVLSFDRV